VPAFSCGLGKHSVVELWAFTEIFQIGGLAKRCFIIFCQRGCDNKGDYNK
jgi:hypothetical protein